jgi:micrococcal nuclease
MKKKYWLILGVIVCCLVFVFLFTVKIEKVPSIEHRLAVQTSAKPTQTSGLKVISVIDGDTVVLSDNRRVRYIGIDSPEIAEGSTEAVAARVMNEQLTKGKEIRIETDSEELDKYGRTLAYIWVGNKMINLELVREGCAKLLTIPPNTKYVNELANAFKEKDGTCASNFNFSLPDTKGNCSSAKPIKGNINDVGEKIFHFPEGEFYLKTNAEACFRSVAEAVASGYRQSKQ